MAPAIEPLPPRRRPSIAVTILLALVAVPALLMTACGASVFVAGVASGVDGLWLAALGLAVSVAGGAGLYALYRVFGGD